jgi:hypothetical protein
MRRQAHRPWLELAGNVKVSQDNICHFLLALAAGGPVDQDIVRLDV